MTHLKDPRHERFCVAFVDTGNATESYVAAGFARRGAAQGASRLLRKEQIRLRVEELRADVAKALAEKEAEARKASLSPVIERKERVLEELEILAFSDLANYEIREDGSVVVRTGSLTTSARAIESTNVERRRFPDGSMETKTRLKLWSKPTALRMLGEHELLFGDQPPTPQVAGGPRNVFVFFGREIPL